MSRNTHREVLDHAPKLGSHLNPVPPMSPEIGKSISDRVNLPDRVSRALAETYALYLRTVGPIYCNLDKLTRQELESLLMTVDETAESIRSVGRAFPARLTLASDSAADGENRAPIGDRDQEEDDPEESPVIVATFTRKLRAVLGITVDSQSDPTLHS